MGICPSADGQGECGSKDRRNARQPANDPKERVLAAGRWLCIVVLSFIIDLVCFIFFCICI